MVERTEVRERQTDSWLVAHAWVREGDWAMASEEERTEMLVMMIDALMVHAPGAGPGLWLQWRAIQHPSGDKIVVLECTWRAW